MFKARLGSYSVSPLNTTFPLHTHTQTARLACGPLLVPAIEYTTLLSGRHDAPAMLGKGRGRRGQTGEERA